MARNILGVYLGVGPSELQFYYGCWEKPSLAEPARDRAIRFNLLHSQGMALCAAVLDREVGADLECIRPLPEAGQIAERFLSAREKIA